MNKYTLGVALVAGVVVLVLFDNTVSGKFTSADGNSFEFTAGTNSTTA